MVNKKEVMRRVHILLALTALMISLALSNSNEIKQRLIREKVKGEIRVLINNQEIKLDNSYCLDFGDGYNFESTVDLVDGKFSFDRGIYGVNKYSLMLTKELCRRYLSEEFDEGIEIIFGLFNTDDWRVYNMDVTIMINNVNDKIHIIVTQVIEDYEGSQERSNVEKVINSSDNKIELINEV